MCLSLGGNRLLQLSFLTPAKQSRKGYLAKELAFDDAEKAEWQLEAVVTF